MARVVGDGGIITSGMEKQYKAMEEVELSYKKPDEVTLAYKHALLADAPLRRYVVVPNANEQQLTIETKIRELVELNSWGPHSYDNEELVEKLKSALGQ
jgi:hypothetical protein